MSLTLLGVVAVALWQTVHDQTEAARRTAEQDAARIAAGLRDRLRSAEVLGFVEEGDRLHFVEGRVQAPESLGWIEAPTAEVLLDELGPGPRSAVQALSGDPAAVGGLLRMAAQDSTSAQAADVLRLIAAWSALRIGKEPQASELLEALLADEHAQRSPAFLCSAALLAVSLEAASPPPALLRRAVVRAHPTQVAGLLLRLEELGVATAPLRELRREADEERTRLRHLDTQLQTGSDSPPSASGFEGGLLLVTSETDGAWVPPGAPLENLLLSLRPRYETRSPTGGPTTGPAAIVDGLVGVDATPAGSGGPLATLLDRSALFVVAAALAIACVFGTLFTRRAWLREREAQQVRSEFLTTVTHELKTPLAGVRLVSEMLVDDHVEDAEERRSWLRRLQGEAVRLGALIENVLDLRRLERGERQFAPRDEVLESLCEEVAAWLGPLLERDGVELRTDLGAGETLVHVDPDAFRQALINLLDNARKYATDGGIVELRVDPARCEVTVRDHGPGIRDGDQERIFERFRRGTPEQHGSTPGAGLGLHLSRSMLRAMGGDLHHRKPSDGNGACFVMTAARARGRDDA